MEAWRLCENPKSVTGKEGQHQKDLECLGVVPGMGCRLRDCLEWSCQACGPKTELSRSSPVTWQSSSNNASYPSWIRMFLAAKESSSRFYGLEEVPS